MTRTAKKKHESGLRTLIDQYIATATAATFNYKQVAAAIGETNTAHHRAIALYLAELAFDGTLLEVSPGRFKPVQRTVVATGTFVRRSNGKNAVITDDDGEPIMIAERNSMHALNGDRVTVSVAARVKGREPEAKVTEIVERNPQTFIGTLRVDKHVGTLVTDSKFLATDIVIPRNKLRGGRTGDKAVVRITDWPENVQIPYGEVVDVLGPTGENNTEIHAILAEYGLPYRYPEAVEKAADKIDAGITPEVVAQREDMRDVTTFTIDPRDAKDFDDALSVRRLGEGRYEVGVHIADVTHYVQPDTIIDREARERATSVYLVDRVVPMLPEHLCNGICSLRPDEDKLAFSVMFEMDDNARVLGYRIARTVIRSNRRFAYEEAQEVIETGHGDYADEILLLDRLAKQLRKDRYASGSVEFDRAEVRFEIDEKGHPVSVYFKESKDANKLIEEFMLLANRRVAEFCGRHLVKGRKMPRTMVYRVHDAPSEEKLDRFRQFILRFGHVFKASKGRAVAKELNRLFARIKGSTEENAVSTMAVRSMAKAFYTTDNIGHYGLAFPYYTHFTSPIRRYPDMMVHRLLARYLAGEKSADKKQLEALCEHASKREVVAAEAERASIKYKMVEFMQEHLGEEFDGHISGLTEWGVYVELDETHIEGMSFLRDIADDFYYFDEQRYEIAGRSTGRRLTLGDAVRIRMKRADLRKRQLDFELLLPGSARPGEASHPDAAPRTRTRTGRRRRR